MNDFCPIYDKQILHRVRGRQQPQGPYVLCSRRIDFGVDALAFQQKFPSEAEGWASGRPLSIPCSCSAT